MAGALAALALVLACAPAALAAPPVNDRYAAALELTGAEPSTAGANGRASAEPGEPSHAGYMPRRSVWWRWTAPATGTVRVDTCGSSFDTLLAVYSGAAAGGFAALTAVAAGDDSEDCGSSSVVSFQARAGQTYAIAVDGYQGATGAIALQLSSTVLPPPPNDAFAAADALDPDEGDSYREGTTLAATAEPGEPDHAGAGAGQSVWYRWTAADAESVTVTACHDWWSGFGGSDTVLGVYSGTDVADLTEIASSDDSGRCFASGGSSVTFDTVAGTEYSVAVDGKGDDVADFALDVGSPQWNDDFADAVDIGDGGGSGATYAATRETGEPSHAGAPAARSVWYRWTAPADRSVELRLCAHDAFQPRLAIYRGATLETLTTERVGQPYDCGGDDAGLAARIDAQAGETYFVAVDAVGAGDGLFDLGIAAAPANDLLAGARTLGPNGHTGRTRVASKEPQEPAHAGDAGGHSLWYRWKAPATGQFVLETCDSTFDTLLAVYENAFAVGELSEVASNDDSDACGDGSTASSVTFEATADRIYAIAVDGKDGAVGRFSVYFRGQPYNDSLASPELIDVGYWGGTTELATKDPGEPDHAGDPGGRSVWFRWAADGTRTVRLDLCDTEVDTLLAVYRRAPEETGFEALSEVAANDDAAGCGVEGRGSRVTLEAQAGAEYLIAVDARGAPGAFGLELREAPENDAFAAAWDVGDQSPSPTQLYGYSRGATKEPGEPAHAGYGGGASVWYRWTAPASRSYAIDTCNSYSFDTLLGVYTGSAVGALATVAAVDDSPGCGGDSHGGRVTIAAQAGTTYWIAVDGKDGADGYFGLTIAPGPPHDDFANAASLFPGFGITGNLAGAGREGGEPDHAGVAGGGSVWYRWTAPYGGTVELSTCSSFSYLWPDTALAVYVGSGYGALAPVAANDDTPGCGNGRQSRVSFAAVAGTEYRVAVAGRNGDAGFFEIRLEQLAANDDFAGAQTIAGASRAPRGSNRFASREAAEPLHAGQPGGRSVWYRWVAPADGSATVETCDSDFDTLLGVYSGGVLGAAVPVAASDDVAGCGFEGGGSRVQFAATAGTEYRIAVDGWDGARGDFRVAVNPPANDRFDAAREFVGRAGSDLGTTVGATTEPYERDAFDHGAGDSVWYRWTAPASGPAELGVCGSGGSMRYGVYTGGMPSELEEVAPSAQMSGCQSQPSPIEFEAVEGVTYRVAVGAYEGSGADFQIVLNRPANDDLEDAEPLRGKDVAVDATTLGATRESGEPQHAGESGGRSVWYRWRAPAGAPGQAMVATCGSAFDALVDVYSGAAQFASLVPVEPNSDPVACAPGEAGTTFSFDYEPGVTYRIAVDGRDGAAGALALRLTATVPPPANDGFDAAEPIDAPAALRLGHNWGATREPDEPAHGGQAGAGSVWYRWVAPADGSVTVGTCDSDFDTLLGVYGGDAIDGLTEVAANDDSPACPDGSGGSHATFSASDGAVYWIAVDGKSGEEGEIELRLNSPPNDDFADAVTIGAATATVAGTTFGASAEPDEPSALPAPAATVWYRWTAPESGSVQLHTCAAGGNPMEVRVHTGASLQSLTRVFGGWTPTSQGGCDGGWAFGTTAALTFGAVAGTTYSIAVDAPADGFATLGGRGAGGPFVLAVNAPANDLRAAPRRVVGADATVAATNVGATKELGEPDHAGDGGGASVWYRWTAPASGPVTLDTCASAIDTLLSLWRPDGAPVAESDDSESCGDGSTGGSVTVDVAEGDTYLLAIDGKGGATGALALAIDSAAEDTTPPETALNHFPAATSATDLYVYVTRDEPGSTFECAVDGGPFAACESPDEVEGQQAYARFSGLAEGVRTLHIRERDHAGNVDPSPAEAQVKVDRTPPDTSILTGPGGLTRLTPSFSFESNESDARFECSDDGVDWFDCFSPQSLSWLGDGEQTFRVRAVDVADNRDPEPATRSFTLDRTAPTTTIVSGPDGAVEGPDVSFELEASEPGVAFTCRLDAYQPTGGSQVIANGPCDSPYERAGLSGPYRLAVRATDPAGNIGAVVTRDFSVADTTPPRSSIAGPGAWTQDTEPSFGFAANEPTSGSRCSLDGAAFAPCTSATTVGPLADGPHSFEVEAEDLAGNREDPPRRYEFNVDTTPPDTTIDGPEGTTGQHPTFTFGSDEDEPRFACRIDGSGLFSCPAVYELPELARGEHTLSVVAIDRAGNVDPTPAVRQFELTNAPPAAGLSLSPDLGPAPLNVTASVAGHDPDGDQLSYTVQWGDGSEQSGTLPSAGLSHQYAEPGLFVVRLAVSDGLETAVATRYVSVVVPEPLHADAGDDQLAIAGEPVRLDASGSRRAAEIAQYEWELADGTVLSGKTVEHVFDEPGSQRVALTVSGPGGEASDSVDVDVAPAPPAGERLRVEVRSGSAAIAGADVAVVLPTGQRVRAVSGGDGVASLRGLPDGGYTVYAHRPGYQPSVGAAEVVGGVGDAVVQLTPGEAATGELTSKPMTIEEIEAAGIDIDDPANQNAYEFELHLNGMRLGGYVGRGGFIRGNGCTRGSCLTRFPSGGYARTTVTYVDDKPILSTLVMPFKATTLKEFYAVSLIVHNLGPSGFVLEHGRAEIDVPAGLALAPTATPQAASASVPDIAGGRSATTKWILRGDVEGEYDLEARYAASLEPVGSPIGIVARTDEPIKVWGASAIQPVFEVDDDMRDRYPYRVRVGLRNVADVPVYNPSLELQDEGAHGYVLQPRQQRRFATAAIAPGDTFWAAPVIAVPDGDEAIDAAASFYRSVAGDRRVGGTVQVKPRQPSFEDAPHVEPKHLGETVMLDWEPVAGATGYEVYEVPDRETAFGDEPVRVDLENETAGSVDPPPDGEQAYYAISAIVDSRRTMVHPLVASPPPPAPGEGAEDALGMPKGDCPLNSVRLGPAELRASCFTKTGNVYEARGRVRVNGIDIMPGDGKVVVDAQQQRITVAEARVEVGQIVLYRGRLDWSPKATLHLALPAGTEIKKLPVSGQLTVSLQPDRATLEADARLPQALGGVAGSLKLAATNADGPKLDLFEVKASGLSLNGRMGIDGVLLKYERTPLGDRWEGGATLKIPRPMSPLKVDGRLALLNGKFSSASVEVDGLNAHIAYGVFLQRLRASFAVDPISLGGGFGLSAGPQVLGKEAISVDGDGRATFGNPQVYELSGSLKVVEAEVASGYFRYRTSGLLEFGGKLGIDRSGFKANVSADGWVDGLRAFNARGRGTFSVSRASFQAEGVVSSVGIAACSRGSGPDVGAGYRWGGDATFFASSCDVGEYEAVRSHAVAGSETASTLAVAPGEPLRVFAFRGAGGPPPVVLTGPDGTRIAAPADGGGIDSPAAMLAQNPDDGTTYVALFAPAGGDWTVDTPAGTPAVASVRTAAALPAPAVSATVDPAGSDAVLRWSLRPIPGQRVQLVERTDHGAQVIATTNEASGVARFAPLPDSSASRQIVAVVEQYGLPRSTVAVERYEAPEAALQAGADGTGGVGPSGAVAPAAPPAQPRRAAGSRRPERPGRVRLRRRGGSVVVAWPRVRGAERYMVAVRLSSGRRVRLVSRRPRVAIRRVSRSAGVAIAVRAIAADGGRGPVRAARLRGAGS